MKIGGGTGLEIKLATYYLNSDKSVEMTDFSIGAEGMQLSKGINM